MTQQGENPATNLQYSTVAQLGDLGEKPLAGVSDGTPTLGKDKSLGDLVQDLPKIRLDDLESAVLSADSKVSSRRLGGRIASAGLKPMIHEASKTVVLPETFQQADNFLGLYTMKACLKLGYEVRVIPYNKPLDDIPKGLEEFNLGIYMSLSDESNSFRFNKKVDQYEIGRTAARSQAIIGALFSNKMDTSVLKENHFYFGNYKPPKGEEDESKKRPPTDYWVHLLPQYILETDLRQDLSKLIIQILRKTWVLIDPGVLWTNMFPYFISYADVVKANCAKEIVVEPPRGKKPAVTKMKVPTKVRNNSLLLKEEIEFINSLSQPIFKPLPWESMSQEDWVKSIWSNGLSVIKKDLSREYGNRAQFLSKLASVTTKRLRQMRETSSKKSLRKSDVQASDLETLLLARENPTQEFAMEILSLDPNHDLFLKEQILGDSLNISKASGATVQENINETVKAWCSELQVYKDLLNKNEEKKQKLQELVNNYAKRSGERRAFFEDLQKRIGANTLNKWKANQIDFDLAKQMKSAGLKVSETQKPKPQKMVPHLSTKPKQGLAKKAKKEFKTIDYNQFFKTSKEQGIDEVTPFTTFWDNVVNKVKKLTEDPQARPLDLSQLFVNHMVELLQQKKPLPSELSEFAEADVHTHEGLNKLVKEWTASENSVKLQLPLSASVTEAIASAQGLRIRSE